jgi:hypothetical protein
VGAFSVGATVQITRQVFYAGRGPSPYASCGEGLRALVGGIERARHEASGMDGEQGALTRFRSALRPEWDHHEAVAETCQGTRTDKRALDAIERLRYAEEHAVRREAGDLAPLRRRVQILVETQLAASREPQ